MKKVISFILCFHRILGVILSILFLMWFLSGMVMMYHYYPSVTTQQIMEHAETVDTLDFPIDVYSKQLEGNAAFSNIIYQKVAGRNTLRFATTDGEKAIDSKSGMPFARYSAEELYQTANNSGWSAAKAELMDTLHAIDVWLIGAMPQKQMPVYRYGYEDDDHIQLYVSAKTGMPVQYTTRSERFWTWIGAIPHWVYITYLRSQGRQPWVDTVKWLSGIATLVVLSGIIIGIRSMILARRQRKLTPYVKSDFRWHHLLGLFFGLFTLTFIFSGYMSMRPVPQWMITTHQERDMKADVYGTSLDMNRFLLPANEVIMSDEIKHLTWMQVGGHAYYKVETGSETYLVDAENTELNRYEFDAERTQKAFEQITGTHDVKVNLLEDYDNYYVYIRNNYPLPVYKIEVNDADKSLYYLNPKDGSVRYYNRNTRMRKWLYAGLHCFNIPFFQKHRILRDILFWIMLLGGTALSVSSIQMSWHYLHRKKRKKR